MRSADSFVAAWPEMLPPARHLVLNFRWSRNLQGGQGEAAGGNCTFLDPRLLIYALRASQQTTPSDSMPVPVPHPGSGSCSDACSPVSRWAYHGGLDFGQTRRWYRGSIGHKGSAFCSWCNHYSEAQGSAREHQGNETGIERKVKKLQRKLAAQNLG